MKKDILSEIVANKRFEIDLQKRSIPLAQLDENLPGGACRRSMRAALLHSTSGIIAEFKRKSPSKGWIKEHAAVQSVVTGYQQAGASALSILTDEKYFGGSLKDIRTASPLVDIPVLRKDFIVDEYQLYQARIVGADAILLIAAALTPGECTALTGKAHELGLEVLLEIHNESELSYITPEIDMVGVNNRHLGTFHTDVQNSFRLAERLPEDTVLVSESGISDPATVKELRRKGFRGFLIGEALMRTENPEESLRAFIRKVTE